MFLIQSGVKGGDTLLPQLLTSFQNVPLKLNGTCRFMLYTDDFNLLDKSINIVKKNKGAVLLVGRMVQKQMLKKCINFKYL